MKSRFLYRLATDPPLAEIQIGEEERKTKMSRALAVSVAIALLCLSGIAQADVFSLGSGLTNLETVLIGDPGNAADTSGYGLVGYSYQIGKYEVTAAQYADFLNNKAKTDTYGLYNSSMWSNSQGCKIQRSGDVGRYTYSVANDPGNEWANRPVNYVSYWASLRFANWLNNGQGDGDTENGAYTIPDGYNGTDGHEIQRNAGAKWFLPSEDEWYKAAYYKGGGTNVGYWDYPMQSDISTTPSNDLTDPDPGNNANFYQSGYTIGSLYYRTNVGEFENSESAYGTFDQGGNVREWNEALDVSTYKRGYRGGGFNNTYGSLLASNRYYSPPTYESSDLGFRVAFVPEPAGLLALSCGLIGLGGVCLRKRR